MKQIMMIIVLCTGAWLHARNRATQDLFDYLKKINENTTINITQARNHSALLIKNGARVNARDDANLTPLMIVAKGDMQHGEDLLEFLITCGADLNVRDHYKDGALNFAVRAQNSAYVKKLIQLGTTITPKMMFDAVCAPHVLELLLPYCTNLEERDYSGDSLLHVAASYSYNVTHLLLDQRVNPLIRNTRDGRSVLHSVFIDSHEPVDSVDKRIQEKKLIITYLMKKGLSFSIEDKYGQTPLHVLIQETIDPTIKTALIEFILALGADPLKKDHHGFSPLHYAAHANQSEVVNALITAIKNHQPSRIADAQAELVDDLDKIERIIQKRNQRTMIGSYMYAVLLNAFAVFGVWRAVMLCRKPKVHEQ